MEETTPKKKIYISGRGLRAQRRQAGYPGKLPSLGRGPVNPLCNGLPREATWAEHMRADLATLRRCDGVCMLRGWERSRGAQIERHVALKRGMPIYTFSEDRRLFPFAPPQKHIDRDKLTKQINTPPTHGNDR